MERRTRIFVLIIIAVVIVGAAGTYTVRRLSEHSYDLIDFDCDEAYVDMQVLTDIGPRVPGSAEGFESAEYVRTRFVEAGLSDVQIEEYPMTTFEVNSASLSLITFGFGGQIVRNYRHLDDFILYQYSGSTNGEVTLELVDVGNGSAEILEGLDVEGKAVLSTQQILPRAAEHGAVAVIVQNVRLGEEIGYPPYCGGIYGGDEDGDSIPYPDANPDYIVPTCSVSGAVGDEIRDAIEGTRETPLLGISTVYIQMDFDTTISKKTIHNVMGDVKGSSGDMIYIVAHRDTTYISPGAVDNACGTVTIMEMARQMATCDISKTIRFIATDAEEKGLLGATEYVKAHEEEVEKRGIIVINLDMNDVNLERVKILNVRCSSPDYRERLRDIKSLMLEKYPYLRTKYTINITEGNGGADGAPFMKRGIHGAYSMGEWGSSWEYHTQWDTIEHVNSESWLLSGIMFGTLALNIAS